MALAAVSISPVGVGTSVSEYVAAAIAVVRAQDRVRYRLDPMFTTLEGELADIYALVARMQEAVFAAGALRVGTVVKIDDRRDKRVSMEEKVAAVERRLGASAAPAGGVPSPVSTASYSGIVGEPLEFG